MFVSLIKHKTMNNPGLSSGELFRYIGETTMSRTTHCCLLKKVRTSERPMTTPLLAKIHIQMHLKWVDDSKKILFSKVLFMDESYTTFDDSKTDKIIINT